MPAPKTTFKDRITGAIQVTVPTAQHERFYVAVKRLKLRDKYWCYPVFFIAAAMFFIDYLEAQEKKENRERNERAGHDVQPVIWSRGKRTGALIDSLLKRVREERAIDRKIRVGDKFSNTFEAFFRKTEDERNGPNS